MNRGTGDVADKKDVVGPERERTCRSERPGSASCSARDRKELPARRREQQLAIAHASIGRPVWQGLHLDHSSNELGLYTYLFGDLHRDTPPHRP